jgi:uncharacterized membrane protein YcaP (DUF421 family)
MMGVPLKSLVMMALVTMGTMFLANYASANNATARKWLKGSPVNAVGNGNSSGSTGNGGSTGTVMA